MSARGGIVRLSVDGETYDAKDDPECTPDGEKREPIVGPDGVHGFSSTTEPATVSGKITVGPNTDVAALISAVDSTVLVELKNGKTFALYHAWYSGSRTVTTKEGELEFHFTARKGEFI